jgi:hypothetical protein
MKLTCRSSGADGKILQHLDSFGSAGFGSAGFGSAGFDLAGFDLAGFDLAGFDLAGFDLAGFDSAQPPERIENSTAVSQVLLP